MYDTASNKNYLLLHDILLPWLGGLELFALADQVLGLIIDDNACIIKC